MNSSAHTELHQLESYSYLVSSLCPRVALLLNAAGPFGGNLETGEGKNQEMSCEVEHVFLISESYCFICVMILCEFGVKLIYHFNHNKYS